MKNKDRFQSMLPTHQLPRHNMRPIIVNELKTAADYDTDQPHRHDYFEVFYFRKGGGVHVIDFKEFEIEDGSIHIVAPGQVHQVKRDYGSSGCVCLFQLSDLDASKAIIDFLFRHNCQNVEEYAPTYSIQQADMELVECIAQQLLNAENNGIIAQLKINTQVAELILVAMTAASTKPSIDIKGEYAQFRMLLCENFKEIRQVQQYAEMLNITEKKLNQEVRKKAGISAQELIHKQLLLEAKRLLLTGNSVKETAYTLNYTDPSHFSKFFKLKTGYSPSDFQNIHVEGGFSHGAA